MGQPHQIHISNVSPFSRAYIRGVRGYPAGRATFAIREIGIPFCKRGGTIKPLLIQFLGLSYCLLETRQSLEIHDSIFQKSNVFRTTVDAVVRRLLLLPEDHIVLLDGIFDCAGSRQDLLTMLLSVGLDTTDLCHMSSPLHLSIVHL